MTTTLALLTDFGLDDPYVGVMKGVIGGIAPQARLIDLTHAIPPQDVRQGALALEDAYSYFPAGTIFLVVIDPGVGTTRQPIAVKAGGYHFVAPDNGVLSYTLSAFDSFDAVSLTNESYHLTPVSQTFHGRDIFAPAAGHLAAGRVLVEMGEALTDVARLPRPALMVDEDRITGEVVRIDRFGNLITSIRKLQWHGVGRLTLTPLTHANGETLRLMAQQVRVTLNQIELQGIQPTYGEVPRGDIVALVGSTGALEIAVNQGSAATRLDVAIGDRVELHIGA